MMAIYEHTENIINEYSILKISIYMQAESHQTYPLDKTAFVLWPCHGCKFDHDPIGLKCLS